MKDSAIKTLLFCTVLVTTALPLGAAFYLLDRALQTSLDLGFNQQIVEVLEGASQNLKTLRLLDRPNQDSYRRQFERVQNLKDVYSNPQVVKSTLRRSLKIYFALGLVAAVALSVFLAVLLTRRIARSYNAAFDELLAHRERVRYLEEMSSWQELAKMLAHEIKNPLTPIEVLVTSLSGSYSRKSPQQFEELLRQTQQMVSEEVNHLTNTVNRFSEFAKLPKVQLVEEELVGILRQHLAAIAATFETAELELDAADQVRARIDATLFRQVLMNIVRNAIEANPGRKVRFLLKVVSAGPALRIALSNDGVPVAPQIVARMFDPYVSGKNAKENMGLGLAIVKKVVIEHGGAIVYEERGGQPTFVITLPGVGNDAA